MNGVTKKLNNIIHLGMALFGYKSIMEEGWDAKVSFTSDREENHTSNKAKVSPKIDYRKDWIVDSGFSYHMTGNVEKLQDLSEYHGPPLFSRPIAHIGTAMIDNKLPLQQVYHAPSLKLNLISVSELTSSGYSVLFTPQDVKLYSQFKINGEPEIEGKLIGPAYVLPAN